LDTRLSPSLLQPNVRSRKFLERSVQSTRDKKSQNGKAIYTNCLTRPKPYPLSAPTIANGVVFAARSSAIESWNLADGQPLPAIPVDIGSDVDFTHLYADGATLFFLGDQATDTASKPGWHPLHAMDITSRKILWTHRVNRQVRFLDNWPTNEILVTPTAVYYENNSLIAKVSR